MVKPKPKVNLKKGGKDTPFEPRILAFCCNWCSYAGADLAGVSRIQYPPHIRILRIMCSGRVEPAHIFAAFESGADGVIVSGCHPGDCHYISGNLHAEEQIEKLKKLLDVVGFDGRRLRLQWVSASEGQRFADLISEFVDMIRTLGPSHLKTDQQQLRSPQRAASRSQSQKQLRSKKKKYGYNSKSNSDSNSNSDPNPNQDTSEAVIGS